MILPYTILSFHLSALVISPTGLLLGFFFIINTQWLTGNYISTTSYFYIST